VPNIRWLIAAITAVHRFVYLVSRGFLGRRIGWNKRALLLWHRGRVSGALHVAPLLYVEDGERFVVVGSNGGDPRDPQWWKNLQKEATTQVQVGRQRYAVRARLADPLETLRLWPILDDSYAHYARYREHSAPRTIPIVLLERR
jgi:deazaflavin-dependent oxidoreductase (nitroreductase family)